MNDNARPDLSIGDFVEYVDAASVPPCPEAPRPPVHRYWAVLCVAPRVGEQAAGLMLARAGFDGFVPMERVVRRMGRRARPVRGEAMGPMFPRYVFGHIGVDDLSTVGAIRTQAGQPCFVGALEQDGRPGRVPDAEIARLRRAATVEGCDELYAARFEVGQAVDLSDDSALPGGFGHVAGILKGELQVLITLLGRDKMLTLPARDCMAAWS